MKPLAYGLVAFSIGAFAPMTVSASMTSAQAMKSVAFISGTWHCTGDGPPEDDTYTFQKNIWRDTDSVGGVTTGTFDVKRQKWVVFFMNVDGSYGVNEASPFANNTMHITVPYPPGTRSQSYTFTKLSNTEFKLGKQTCFKK
jgi:hypothetical protein